MLCVQIATTTPPVTPSRRLPHEEEEDEPDLTAEEWEEILSYDPCSQ